MSLQGRSALLTFSVGSAIVVVLALANYLMTLSQLEAAYLRRADLLTDITKNGLRSMMLNGRGREFQEFIRSLIADDIEAIRVFGDDGTILSSTIPGETGKKIDTQESSVFASDGTSLMRLKETGDFSVYSSLFVLKNLDPCQRCHGSTEKIRGILNVEISSDEKARTVRNLRIWSLASLAAVLLAFAAGAVFLARYFIGRPFEAVKGAIEERAAPDLLARIRKREGDEVQAVTSMIETLFGEIEKSRGEIEQCHREEVSQMEKMASVGEVAAAVAHEIKNPLAGISGALQVIAEDIPDENPRKEICREILSEIERLDDAVKNLVFFARPPEPNLVLTDLDAVIEKVRSAAAPAAGKSSVTIRTEGGSTPEAMVDPVLIEKALRAIVMHAVHAMPGGGTVTIAPSLSPSGESVEISVMDRGGGMSDEQLRHIFKPFFSMKQAGAGLGLAISRSIIESHHGRIAVESLPGIGSVFRVIIPVKR